MTPSPILTAIEALEEIALDLECRYPGSAHYCPNCDNSLHDTLLRAQDALTTLRASLAEQEGRMEELRGLIAAADFTRLNADYVRAPEPGEGDWPEGWRIHDFPDEPNPQGVWTAHFIAGGMDEAEAKAVVAAVNFVRALLQPSPDKGGAT